MAVVRLSGTSCLLATTDHLVNLVFGGLLWTPLLGNSDLSLVVGAMCRETPGHEVKSPIVNMQTIYLGPQSPCSLSLINGLQLSKYE